MAGSARREPIKDTLAGWSQINPARLAGPGLRTPTMPAPKPTITSKISAALGEWSSETLKEVSASQNRASMIDGAIANTQGQAYEDLVTSGADKWALDGHRVLTAQSVNSQLQASQIQLIEDSAFALSQDQYREQLTAQMTSLTEGQDEFTSNLIMQGVAEMLPELVGRQTLAHANFQEQQTFDAVVQSLGAQSSDDVGRQSLLNMAFGDGTAAGLSTARKDQAITEGIVLSFVNGNPLPYWLMKSNGVLDDFTTDQLNRINDAETQHQNRLRNDYNAERLAQHMALNERVKKGDDPRLNPERVMQMHIAIDAEHFITSTHNEAKTFWSAAEDPANTAKMTRFMVAKNAALNGDHQAFGAATLGLILGVESAPGDPDDIEGPLILHGASKGTKAQGLLQVTQLTLDNPGFGIRPSDGTVEDNYRVGTEYWTALIMGTDSPSGQLKYPPFDVEAAAIAYNAGFTNANHWEQHDRDYSVLPDQAQTEAYAKKVVKAFADMQAPLVGSKYNVALADLTATRKVVKAENYAQATMLAAGENQKWLKGTIDQATWKENLDAIYSAYKVDMNQNIANSMIATIKLKIKAADKIMDAQAFARVKEELLPIQFAFDAVMRDNSTTDEQMQEAMQIYTALSNAIFTNSGLLITDSRSESMKEANIKTWRASIESHQQYAKEQAQIEFAKLHGGWEDLPVKLQKRHLEQQAAETMRKVNEGIAASGEPMTPEVEEEVAQIVNTAMMQEWKKVGNVPQQSVRAESHLMTNKVIVTTVDPKTGKEVKTVNPEAVGGIRRYQEWKTIAPEQASSFYTPEARIIAEAAIAMAGTDADNGALSTALWEIVQENALTKVSEQDLDSFVLAAKVDGDIAVAMRKLRQRQDVSLLQAFWSRAKPGFQDVFASDAFSFLSSERRMLMEEKATQDIADGIEWELRQMKLLNRYSNVDLLVPLAMDRLMEHSAFLGGTFIVTDFNMMKATFGDRAGIYDKVNILHDVVVNWANSPEVLAEHPEFSSKTWTEWLVKPGQELLGAIGNILGVDSNIDKGMSFEDAPEALLRNLRPFVVHINTDGQVVMRVMNKKGVFEGPGLVIPWREAGNFWIKSNPIIVDRTPGLGQKIHGAIGTMINRGVRIE